MRAGVGLLPQAVEPLDRRDDPEVADRQHVRPAQAEHQEHLRRPSAQPLHLDDRLDDRVVVELVQRGDRQLAALHLRREVAEIADLLAAEPGLRGTGRRSARAARPASTPFGMCATSRPWIVAAALVEICCAVIVRTSAGNGSSVGASSGERVLVLLDDRRQHRIAAHQGAPRPREFLRVSWTLAV